MGNGSSKDSRLHSPSNSGRLAPHNSNHTAADTKDFKKTLILSPLCSSIISARPPFGWKCPSQKLLSTGEAKMAQWRKGLFAFLSRNAWNVSTYFNIPPNRVVELGSQVEL